MRKDGLFGNILKIVAAGAILYIAYKLIEKNLNKKTESTIPPVTSDEDITYDEVVEEKTEEQYVVELIEELREKKNKTKNDKYNIELLEIKLKQIRGQK
jgi:hypothetical protein